MPNWTALADGLLFPEGPVACADSSVLLVEIERRTISRVTPGGKVDVVAEVDGMPNGLAVGPDGALYVCNNGGFLFQKTDGINRVRPGVPEGYAGGWIERVDIRTGERQVLYTRCGEHALVGPNDLVFDRHGGFYFTDHGKRYPRFQMNGGLYYALADGSRIVEVAYPLITPNGVGLSPDGAAVYVAETDTGRLWAFDLVSPGVARRRPGLVPHGGRLVCGLPGYQRFDSLLRQCLRRDPEHGLHLRHQPGRQTAVPGRDRRSHHDQHLLRRPRPPHRIHHAVGQRTARQNGMGAPRPRALLRVERRKFPCALRDPMAGEGSPIASSVGASLLADAPPLAKLIAQRSGS